MSGQKKQTLCFLALTILGLLFFYQTINYDFVNFDDPIHTTENIAAKTFDLRALLTKYYLGIYHPLTTLSFAFDWWLGGPKPWPFHLNNLIFHLLGTLVLLKVCLKLWPKKYLLGFLISLTFMLHPLKAESVAWITERKDVLSGLFLWLAIYIYLLYLEGKRLWQYILANIAFLLAVASKVSVVPLPLFLFVIDWYKNKKIDFKSVVRKSPFFLIALIFGLVNLLEQLRLRAALDIPQKNYSELVYQIQFYLEKFIFPLNLRAWYSYEFLNFNLLGVVTLVLICLLTIYIFKKAPAHRKDPVLGWSLFALFLFPNIKLITHGDHNLVNDRYMYIALTGLTFAFFPFILHTIERFWRNKSRVISVGLSCVLASIVIQWLYLMHLQIPTWENPLTLWQRAITVEPNSRFINREYGRVLMIIGEYEVAIPYLLKNDSQVDDFANLGYALTKLKRIGEAENVTFEGLKKFPDHSSLLQILAIIKLDQAEYKEALALFTKALQHLKDEQSPRFRAIILHHIGLCNRRLGNYEAAESFYRQSMALDNSDETLITNLGEVLIQKEDNYDEAKNIFGAALKLNPNRASTYNNIGFIYYQEKNYAEATIWFRRAVEIDPYYEVARNNLMATLEKGKQKH